MLEAHDYKDVNILSALGEWWTMDDDELSDALDHLIERVWWEENQLVRAEAIKQIVFWFDCHDRPLPQRKQLPSLLMNASWLPVLDGDARARALYERHYSAQKNMKRRKQRKTKLFVGPGEKLILLSPLANALFVWRREILRADRQIGVNCAVFRNESSTKSSSLIREAVDLARCYWPYETRFFTFVDPSAVKSSNLGYCFKMAGWKKGKERTGKNLLIYSLEQLPTCLERVWGDY